MAEAATRGKKGCGRLGLGGCGLALFVLVTTLLVVALNFDRIKTTGLGRSVGRLVREGRLTFTELTELRAHLQQAFPASQVTIKKSFADAGETVTVEFSNPTFFRSVDQAKSKAQDVALFVLDRYPSADDLAKIRVVFKRHREHGLQLLTRSNTYSFPIEPLRAEQLRRREPNEAEAAE